MRDERGEIATSYLFLIAMSLLLFVAVMGLGAPIRLSNQVTEIALGENTP
jgi:hypothetical protein